LLLKKEKFTCADKTFFFLGFGNTGFGQTNKKHFFFAEADVCWNQKKKRAKNTSSASHHIA
jgi:hypothetical protein